jgi:zinc transport system substrate-binding protein
VISRIVLILAAAAAFVSAGCGSGMAASNGRKSVVASFYPLAYAAEQVGGSTVEVHDLTPSGAEPHDLELTPRAVADIQGADVVLYLGHGFQPAVSDAIQGANGRTVDLLRGLPVRAGDPHVWLDPILYARIARQVGALLHRPTQAAALVARLDALDRTYRAGLAHCARHDAVTSHAAFGYLAHRYGLRQVPITGVNPEAEPSARQLADVVEAVRRTHTTTVFFERLVSPRVADTVARETGANAAVLDPIEGLTPSEQSQGDTYFTLMRRNLAALRKALGCR